MNTEMARANDEKKFSQMRMAITKLEDGLYHNRRELFGDSISSGEVNWQQGILRRLKEDGYIEPRSTKPDPKGFYYKITEQDILSPFLDDDTLYAYIWPADPVSAPTIKKTIVFDTETTGLNPGIGKIPVVTPVTDEGLPFLIEGQITAELLEKMLMAITPNIIFIRDKLLEVDKRIKAIEDKFDKLYRELGGKSE